MPRPRPSPNWRDSRGEGRSGPVEGGNPIAECLTLTGAVKPGCLRWGWWGGLTAPARAKGGLAIGLPPVGWLRSCCGRVRAARWLRRSRSDRLETSAASAWDHPRHRCCPLSSQQAAANRLSTAVIRPRVGVGGRWLSWSHDDLDLGPAPALGSRRPRRRVGGARAHKAAEDDEARQVMRAAARWAAMHSASRWSGRSMAGTSPPAAGWAGVPGGGGVRGRRVRRRDGPFHRVRAPLPVPRRRGPLPAPALLGPPRGG